MRALLSLLLLLPMTVFAASPNQVVFAHECKAVNTDKTGLQCGTWRARMHLHWVKSKKEMTPAQSEAADYEYARITMRYFDLGGQHFDVTANYWPAGAMKSCFIKPSRAVYCHPVKCDAQYKKCEAVNQ